MQTRGTLPGVVAGKYRIGQTLGRGGAGAVSRARDESSNRDVAFKIFGPEALAGDAGRRLFLEGGRILAALRHPAIVPVIDFGILPDGRGFAVMELVAGEDLRTLLQREGALDAARAAAILASVSEGLEEAHRQGILHLDLKPENIVLPEEATGAVARLLDFSAPGLVRLGTPAYMAPEQLRGATVDRRTDVFALGVIACEMLSGGLPFGRGSAAEVMLAQSQGVPQLPEGVPAALGRAVRGALDSDSDRRPATPQAFAHLVNAWTAGV